MARNLKWTLLFVGSLLPAVAAWATQQNLARGVTAYGDSPTQIGIVSNSPELTTISLNNPEIVIDDHTVDYQTYQSFGMAGEPFLYNEGSPAVPAVRRFYRIPNTGGVDLVITDAEFEVVDNIDPMPYMSEEGAFGTILRDEVAFSQDRWYPDDIATMSDPMIMRDFRLVEVALFPVQVNPVTRQARIYRNISVDVVANDEPGFNELLNPGPVTGSWVPIYRGLIPNLTEDDLINATNVPGNLLILVSQGNQIRPWADSLAQWKKRKGYKTRVEARSDWTTSTMTSFIRTQYSDINTRPEFVVIMGDPSWSGQGLPTNSSDFNFDHPFALGNTNDDLEDIGVGRLSGSSSTEMATINAKIMAYERSPNLTDTLFHTKAFCYGDVGHSIASNFTLMQWCSQQFRLNTGITDVAVDQCNNGVNENTVRTQINGGLSFFLWRGSWLGQMSTSLAGNCTNGDRLPVGMMVTCGANDFAQGLGIAESWLVAGSPSNLKGCVATVGTSTSGTHAPPNGCFAGGLMYSITTMEIEHFGHALNAGKAWLTRSYGPGGEGDSFVRWNNLMGDPSLSMWTERPTEVTVTHAPSLNVGARNLNVNVSKLIGGTPIEDVLVVAWKGDECYVRGLTDALGAVSLPLTINTPGDLLLTVTKRNHAPYLATIPCATADRHVAVSSFTIDDDNAGGTSGNGNGLLNSGEVVDIRAYFRNFGSSATATGVTATAATDNDRVTINSGTINLTNVAPGDSTLGTLRASVSPLMQNLETAILTVNVSHSEGQAASSVMLTNSAGLADYVSHTFSGAFDPGSTANLRVTLRNNGTLDLIGVNTNLISLSPYVAVEDFQATFGDIPMNQERNNQNDQYQLRANTQAYRGHIAPMLLVSTAANGYVDSTRFTINVGTITAADPTGPDVYGYYAYDNTDVAYTELVPTFDFVDVSSSGTNLNINDPGEKTTPSPVYSVVRELPFTFRYYGQDFDSVTICSNGWLAFGSQPWADLFRNFPMPSQQAPNAMVAPYWDDLQTSGAGRGVWWQYDDTNHRLIIQWKAVGAFATSTNLNFEVILEDEAFHPTFTGDGRIIFQYQTVSLNLNGDFSETTGQSIGIQAPYGLNGLPYNYQNSHQPGAASVANGRAILFTTDARLLFGEITGTVTNARTGQPMAGVTVSIDGQSYRDLTDAAGQYLIQDVLIGSYNLRSSFPLFNDATTTEVLVEQDLTTTRNFSMLHPEFELSSDTLNVTVPEQPDHTTFNIINDGNGPLDYNIFVTYAGDGSTDPWNLLTQDVVNVTGQTGDYVVNGVEFVGDYWYVSGGNGPNGDNMIYKFDLHGQLAGSVAQPSTDPYGWFDMAYDGTLLYGGDQTAAEIKGINPETGQVVSTIPSPLRPTRAIAYNPSNDHFWVADYGHEIYEITRTGTIIQTIPNRDSLSIAGLAWHLTDVDGYRLYIFSQDGTGNFTRVTRMHPASHDFEHVVDLEANPGDRAGGCTITGSWNSTLLVFGGILNNPNGDRIGIYEVDFNTTWLGISPMAMTVPGPGQQVVNVSFDTQQLRPFTYRVNINITCPVLDSTYVLPVVLTVQAVAADEPSSGLPTQFALHQNFPNPFNPSTSIRYDLATAGPTKLTVFDVQGREVAILVDQLQTAGRYEVSFDATALASGLYFYRLESGSFSQAAKMILMK